jgi:hypothetical protein
MQSRERNYALKLADRRCAECGIKASKAKGREVDVEVHHTNGIDWDGVVDMIISRVLQEPEDYTILCKECHKKHHESA